jgi:dTDP-glucose 4,6-dehydratase
MKDVCDATWKIMMDGNSGETYHISTNEVISIRSLVERICAKLNVAFDDHVEFVGDRIGKDSAYHLDSKKIRAELGWEDEIFLEQGLDECIAWVKTNFEALKKLPFDYQHKP